VGRFLRRGEEEKESQKDCARQEKRAEKTLHKPTFVKKKE